MDKKEALIWLSNHIIVQLIWIQRQWENTSQSLSRILMVIHCLLGKAMIAPVFSRYGTFQIFDDDDTCKKKSYEILS